MGIKIDTIFGLPPYDKTMKEEYDIIKDSMPTARIYPCVPEFTTGLATFKLRPAEKYFDLLESHGYTLNSNHVTVAFQADSFPTDSFQNNYSESFFQNVSSGISQGASTLMQTMGARSGTEGAMKLMNAGSEIFKALDMNSMASGLQSASQWTGEKAKKLHTLAQQNNGAMGNLLKSFDSVLGGSRFDFPMIWTDSSFQPSYTMTVRLYNPDPGNQDATDKYIIGPLAALLLLGLPISDDPTGSTYNYPFLHKIKCDGIYFLNPCFISNISVIKGGDQQQIAYNQRMGIVDVRIDFGSLFSSMLATEKHNNSRPTLRSYLEVMKYDKILDEKLSDEYFIDDTNLLFSDPFSPITTSTIDDLPKRISDEVNEIEYNILDSMIGDLGSLKRVAETGYTIPTNLVSELYKNGVISAEDVFSVFPDFKLPEFKVQTAEYIQNISKSSMSLFSGLGSSAAALANNIADLNGLEQQLNEMIATTSGDILPPIYFNGTKISDKLTKSQAFNLIKSIKDKKLSMIDTIGSALNRMDSELSYLNDLSSNFNNISGLTNFLSSSLHFSSYTDLMDNILHPGNILDNAKDILGDIVSSGIKFNANNMFKGIIETVSDKLEHMDILKNIISSGVDFVGKMDIIDMIKNGVDFDPKNVLLQIAGDEINFQATGILNSILGKNYNFDATTALRYILEPGKSFKESLNISNRLKSMVNDLKESAVDTGVDLAKDLGKDMLNFVKSSLHKSKDTMKINPKSLIDKTTEIANNELNKGNIMIRDFLKKEIHTLSL